VVDVFIFSVRPKSWFIFAIALLDRNKVQNAEMQPVNQRGFKYNLSYKIWYKIICVTQDLLSDFTVRILFTCEQLKVTGYPVH